MADVVSIWRMRALAAVVVCCWPAVLAAADFPVAIDNCGVSQTYSAAPKRAVAMNQSAAEIMLTLGLQVRMAGTAYLDDAVLPELGAAYRRIPVVAAKYPSREGLLGIQPDFVYATFASAFATMRLVRGRV